ncbi:MAG: transposase [Acidobacteria bacterium]|nr:transposase [Acidobacteriota bacterium]
MNEIARSGLPHLAVQHHREYVTGDGVVHTQGIEGFWSLLKRGLNGTFHHVTPEYLGMYCDEFAFRYNARKMNDGERFASALGNVKGRLSWYASEGENPPAS